MHFAGVPPRIVVAFQRKACIPGVLRRRNDMGSMPDTESGSRRLQWRWKSKICRICRLWEIWCEERRTALGLTQTELGARVGWAQERVSVLRARGKYGLPSIPQLSRLAQALDIRLVDMIHATGLDIGDPAMHPEPRRHDAGQIEDLHKRVLSTVDRMHTVESRLVHAERQLSRGRMPYGIRFDNSAKRWRP